MDIFGRKALQEAEERARDLKEQLDRERETTKSLRERLAQKERELGRVQQEKGDLEARLQRQEEEEARLRADLKKSESMVDWLNAQLEKAKQKHEELSQRSNAVQQRAQEQHQEAERLRQELARAQANGSPEGAHERLRRLEEENKQLRTELARYAERLRIAQRKAEHNRRAYLVTKMQLDLAEDKLYVLTTGSARPRLAESRSAERGGPDATPEDERTTPADPGPSSAAEPSKGIKTTHEPGGEVTR